MPVSSGHKSSQKVGRSVTGDTSRKTAPVSEPRGTFLGIHRHRHDDPAAAPSSSRRPGPVRQDSVHTRYMNMLLSQDLIPRLHNILASFFNWVLLAGFVVFPGTFTSIQSSLDRDEGIRNNDTAAAILSGVKNVPLVVVAGVCCGIGAAGMLWLTIRWRENYVWLLNRLFLPGIMNALAGLISTLTSVYSQHNGEWSITAKVTGIAEGACMAICGVLFIVFNNLLLNKVKRKHDRHMEQWGDDQHSDEGIVEKIGRKAMEPGLEPGSVV